MRAHLGPQGHVLFFQFPELLVQHVQLQQPLGHAEGLVEAKRRGAAGVGFALLGGDGDDSEQLVLLGELVLQLINLHTES